jgi:putative ABC transport system permease protein
MVMAMIALPVAGVTAVDVVFRTAYESIDEFGLQSLGQADAIVAVYDENRQAEDGRSPSYLPHRRKFWPAENVNVNVTGEEAADRIRTALGADATLSPLSAGTVEVTADGGPMAARAHELDLASPLADGIFHLAEGRWPERDDEVLVTPSLVAAGATVGEPVTVAGGSMLTVVGRTEENPDRSLIAFPGVVLTPSTIAFQEWLVDAAGPITWRQAVELADQGMSVHSRDVIDNPPAIGELPPSMEVIGAGEDDVAGPLAFTGLVMSMILLEVVLLAGPAFAVGARRSQRSLAVLGTNGATPRVLRRVVLAQGVVLGAMSAVVGVGLGVVLGLASLPVLGALIDTTALDRPHLVPLDLAIIFALAATSALLAAVVPAFGAARRSMVEVLAGQRGSDRVRPWLTALGLAGLALSVALSLPASGGSYSGLLLVTLGALLAVVSAIAVLPALVAGLGRLSGLLPLPVRYALRDGARNRNRTVPAVAASMATVAGAVAQSVVVASYESASEATYSPLLSEGSAVIHSASPEEDWTALKEVVEQEVPGGTIHEVLSIDQDSPSGVILELAVPGRSDAVAEHDGPVIVDVAVSDGSDLDALFHGWTDDQLAAAEAILTEGGAVVPMADPVDADAVAITAVPSSEAAPPGEVPAAPSAADRAVEVPAAFLGVDNPVVNLIVAPVVVDELEVPSLVTDLVVTGVKLTRADHDRLADAAAVHSQSALVYVETGYQRSTRALWTQVGLGSLAAALMVGGTLTATLLALADARSDLATLAAVGAAPRMRRWIAGSYALTIGALGAVAGTAIGLLTGLSTLSVMSSDFPDLEGSMVVLPWTLLTVLVVGLPTVMAALVAAGTRARLPSGAYLTHLAH